MLESFPPGVSDHLKNYVYRLLDPRTGETFYVGKGIGNRVFAHCRGEIGEDEECEKLRRIREIRLQGLDVIHVIHRHGLDGETAFEVEAALIDAYPGLSNSVKGQGSGDRGAMHVKEIVALYQAEEAVFDDKALLINVNREASERSIYEAVRYAWRINTVRAMEADVILATRQGMIIGAFIANQWLPATKENFQERWAEDDHSQGRKGFVGEPAPEFLKRRYVGKRVPDRYRPRGAANPIRYCW